MQRVCIVLPDSLPVPAVKGGAIETLIQQIIDYNETYKELNITILTVQDQEAEKYHKHYKLTKFIQFRKLPASPFMNKIEYLLRVLRRYLNLSIHITPPYMKNIEEFIVENRNEFDYVINESYDFYGFKKVSRIIGREKVFAHLHCYVRGNSILDSVYGKIITVSEYIKQCWLKTSNRPDNDIIVLKNGIELSKFQKDIDLKEIEQLHRTLNIGINDFVILYCGRIVPQKGVKELIEAIITINNPRIKLLIVGSPEFGLKTDSTYLKEIQELVLKNKSILRFTGFIDNNNLYKYHAISDIAVVPSTYEDPAPLVPIECMANGTPVIVTDTGGAWEYVDQKCARKVIKGKELVEHLQDAIIELMGNAEMREKMKQNAKIKAEEFSALNFYYNFVKLFND